MRVHPFATRTPRPTPRPSNLLSTRTPRPTPCPSNLLSTRTPPLQTKYVEPVRLAFIESALGHTVSGIASIR
jgi:hypothetical protein